MPFCFIISQGGVSMGFTMKNKNVQFEFITENSFIQTDGETVAEVINRAPTPTIMPKDRLLLPVGEGIAINVDEYYESGEFSCDRIGGDFCYGHNGSISMILLERNKNYLAICPNDPVNATYTVKKEDGIYHLSLTCRRKATVCYKVSIRCPRRADGTVKSTIRTVGRFPTKSKKKTSSGDACGRCDFLDFE